VHFTSLFKRCAIAATAALSFSAGAQTAIKMSLDWRFEAPNSGFLVALDRGYYKAEGLDVTIDPGNGSVDGINRVASGSYDVATADINSLIRYRDNPGNPPIKAVFMQMNSPAFAITALKKSGITRPKDLEGKVLGAPAADGAYANWPAFVKAAKIDGSKVKIENVGFPVREPMLMQGKVDAITSFAYSSVVALRSNGFSPEDITVMYMRDFGLELYGNALLASPKLMQENPEALRKFVRATIKGYFDVASDPAFAISSVLKRNPVTTEAAERMRLGLFLNDNYFTKEVKANGVGHVDTARMGRALDQIGETFKYTTRPKVTDFYTDTYLPAKAERMVPGAVAAKTF
jgi:NitT/TauT family transport system substrate-binding protein